MNVSDKIKIITNFPMKRNDHSITFSSKYPCFLSILPRIQFPLSSPKDRYLILIIQLMHIRILLALISICLAIVQQTPVIGVYTQIDQYDQPSTKEFLSTYISAAYVKYVWMSGAQVVPLYAFSEQADLEIALRKVNGVLFTGGAGEDEIHKDNRWVKNAYFIVQFAISENKKGNIFPVWGTCLGLQILTYVTSGFDEAALQPITDVYRMLNVLNFTSSSYLYDDLGDNLRAKLTTKPGITFFNHQVALKVQNFRNNRYLMDFWKVTSTTVSPAGQLYVSTLEANDYPIFATQYHPQKNLYEWNVPACRTAEGVQLAQILSNKFVELARKNPNRFPSNQQLQKSLIYNFKLSKTNLSYMLIYPFKEPRPDDWPYSNPSLSQE